MSTDKQAANPFALARAAHVNVGTVDIEGSRAVAEAQGQLVIAKKFPRDPAAAFEQVMNSCKRPSLAAQATYSYPKGGQTISGPSIRLAEELARAWGNLSFGIRELSQRDGVSEMQAYCWDLQTNVRSEQNFTVKHERHTNQGVKRLTDPRDIYELTANQAGRRLRARILAILPPDLVEAALEQCRATLVGNAAPDAVQVGKVVKAFSKYGITQQHIEARLGHQLEAITAEELADLINIGNSIRDNMSSATDWFDLNQQEPNAVKAMNEKVNAGQPNAAVVGPDENPVTLPGGGVEKLNQQATKRGAKKQDVGQQVQPTNEQAPEAPAVDDEELV